MKDGHSVCIFAEGDATWDGRTDKIFPATGKLARASGVSLLTYRLEGGYLSRPRWSQTIRRGKMYGHPVRLYSPEELKKLRAEEITALIEKDIHEDAWERQRVERVKFRGKRLAEKLELALFCCPNCGRIGTLHSLNDRFFCDCGLSLRYGEDGFFDPPQPFETVADWEDWQQDKLKNWPVRPGEALFSDDGVSLTGIGGGHSEEALVRGRLSLFPDCLLIEDRAFTLQGIANMAMVQKHLLLFSYEGQYYELRAEHGVNFRKYLSWWKASCVKQE